MLLGLVRGIALDDEYFLLIQMDVATVVAMALSRKKVGAVGDEAFALKNKLQQLYLRRFAASNVDVLALVVCAAASLEVLANQGFERNVLLRLGRIKVHQSAPGSARGVIMCLFLSFK